MSSAGGIPRKWNVADSAEVYGVKYWGNSYASIQRRRERASRTRTAPTARRSIWKERSTKVARGAGSTCWLSGSGFSDVLKSRIVELNETFKRAIAEYGYKGDYKGVYPIKVNQHRFVVEGIDGVQTLPQRPRGGLGA